MGPAQFVTDCVTNRKREVNETHIPQIRCIEPLSELGGQSFGKQLYKTAAVVRAFCFALFLLHDLAPMFQYACIIALLTAARALWRASRSNPRTRSSKAAEPGSSSSGIMLSFRAHIETLPVSPPFTGGWPRARKTRRSWPWLWCPGSRRVPRLS